ncbi:tyrosine-protein phosphatase [Saccharomonospora sp. NPDC006951]
MAADRHLAWEGCFNVRDLGGLPTTSGRLTLRGSIVRGDAPDRLTVRGWESLWADGIRTIIDLRGAEEGNPDSADRPAGLTTVPIPLDDHGDTEFWTQWGNGLDCTPLYYRAFIDRFPATVVHVLGTIADATGGGVLVHCAGGRDRTGLVALLLLAVVGCSPETIAADYALSAQRLAPLWKQLGLGDQDGKIAQLLAARDTTVEHVIHNALSELDVEPFLLDNGLGEARLDSLKARLLGAN